MFPSLTRRALAEALLAAAAAAALSSSALAEDVPTITLTTYGGNYENFFRQQVIPGFEAKYKAKVKLAVGLSKDWLAEIRASGHERAAYDVVMMNDIWASQLRREKFFLPFDEKIMPNLRNARFTFKQDDDTVSVIGNVDPVGIAYRTDLVTNPPTKWADLWKPEYKGKLGIYTLINSVGAMTMFTASKLFYGDEFHYEEGINKVFELKPFKLSEFSGDMEKLLTMGEVEICPMSSPGIKRLKKKGVAVEWIAPEEHLMMFEQVFSVHKATKHPELAQQFVNYMLTPEVQEKFVRVFFATPAVRGVTIPEEVKDDLPIGPDDLDRIAIWDWDKFNQQKAKLIRYWNRNVNR